MKHIYCNLVDGPKECVIFFFVEVSLFYYTLTFENVNWKQTTYRNGSPDCNEIKKAQQTQAEKRCQYNIIDLPSKRDLATSKSSEVFYRKKACEVF
jgi:hypothetical protein